MAPSGCLSPAAPEAWVDAAGQPQGDNVGNATPMGAAVGGRCGGWPLRPPTPAPRPLITGAGSRAAAPRVQRRGRALVAPVAAVAGSARAGEAP